MKKCRLIKKIFTYLFALMNGSSKLSSSFLEALEKSFSAYNKHGARSNEKLVPIHKWFGDVVSDRLGEGYNVMGLGRGKECNLEGKYNPKNLDIAVLKNGKIISTISFKFVTSNYKQNGNNYFEGLCGETANVRRVGVGFAHFLVLRAHTPYYDKNKGGSRGVLKKMEIINNHDLSKYINLFNDNDYPHRPDIIGVAIVDIDEGEGDIFFTDLDGMDLSDENKKILRNDFSIDKFVERFLGLCKLKS